MVRFGVYTSIDIQLTAALGGLPMPPRLYSNLNFVFI
jgi:hypothetical protein